MITTEIRADELIPGDRFDTKCGVGALAFATITRVRYLDNDHSGASDRVEVTYAGNDMSPTETLLAGSTVRIATL